MSDDWLETGPGKPTAGLPAVVAIPAGLAERVALVEACWSRLTLKQRTFLTVWRECGLNERRAVKKLGLSHTTKPMTGGMQNPDFATVVQVWRGSAAQDALDKDRLLARQDDIVETLLTPKPVLHQGLPVFDPRHPGNILEEVEAGAASKANETLMRAAGLLKDKDVDVNVGMVGPSFTIQVVQKDGGVIDVTPRAVPVSLPEPEDEWPSAP